MPNQQLYTNEAAFANAATQQTALAAGKLRLIKDPFTMTVSTTKAQMVAQEADFDGYPAGGYAVAAWSGPLFFSGGGSVLTSTLVGVTYGPAGVPPTGNSITAWWYEDAAGVVRLSGTFDPAYTLAMVGQGFEWLAQQVIGRNASGPV